MVIFAHFLLLPRSAEPGRKGKPLLGDPLVFLSPSEYLAESVRFHEPEERAKPEVMGCLPKENQLFSCEM